MTNVVYTHATVYGGKIEPVASGVFNVYRVTDPSGRAVLDLVLSDAEREQWAAVLALTPGGV